MLANKNRELRILKLHPPDLQHSRTLPVGLKIKPTLSLYFAVLNSISKNQVLFFSADLGKINAQGTVTMT